MRDFCNKSCFDGEESMYNMWSLYNDLIANYFFGKLMHKVKKIGFNK